MIKTGLLLTVTAFAGAALLAGCGGSDSSSTAPDPKKIPTATLPAVLPDPLIIEGWPLPSAPSGDTYVVESGDSLYLIAERLGVSLEDLLELNPLADPTALEVGQVLRIPGSRGETPTPEGTRTPRPPTPEPTVPTPSTTRPPPPTPQEGQTTYIVQSGDNANDIALRFGITVEDLASANNTTVDDLRSLEIGDVLIIPVSSTPAPAEETEPPPETPTPEM